ncbi:hypothetical protein [Flavobacterium lipolyticum]|uniref:Squalene cyclase C-terminal domain-containing protein n=1 Tax=Flavobacterium lipolyticum TaxID=2893754 RepID=A0ABS8LUG1_9FLAO|nr:hypothetical protein [Flavobacterium sp. F-126]MCC9016210.1 hypothetical protein [Flavobacterium sp. F-126]
MHLEKVNEYIKSERIKKQLINGRLPKPFHPFVLKEIENNLQSPYIYYAYLFAEPFDFTDYEIVEKICYASLLYKMSLLVLDKITDGQFDKDQTSKVTLVQHALEKESLRIIVTELGTDKVSIDKLWEAIENRTKEWYQSYQLEKEIKTKDFDIADFEKLSELKVSVALIPLDFIKEFSNGSKAIYDKVTTIHKLFYIAYQILDDIIDFDEDLKNGQYNIAIHKTKKLLKDNGLSSENLNSQILYVYAFDDLYKLALTYIDKALNLCLGMNAYLLERRLLSTKALFENKNYMRLKECVESKISIPFEEKIQIVKKTEINNALSQPVRYILKKWSQDFIDLNYIQAPISLNDLLTTHYALGDTFLRAMATTHLIEIQKKDSLKEIITEEQNYILSQIGLDKMGWSYHPLLIEVPYDADSLGQILQSFSKYYDNELFHTLFENPILSLLKVTESNHGIFPTWTIFERNSKQLNFYTDKYWGRDNDLAVIANMGCGLYIAKEKTNILNQIDFERIIITNADYLVNNQEKDGSFGLGSRWYSGCFYPTYICLKFLYKVDAVKYNEAIKKAQSWIIKSQNKTEGRFGKEKHASTETAFAVLTLLFEETPDSEIVESIKKGIHFLEKEMKEDGEFRPSPFIKQTLTIENKKPYLWANKVITTSFCALAIEKYKSFNPE